MAGPRVTGPVAKLARSITTASQQSSILTSSKAGAPLSRKYADLLKERNIDSDVSLSAPVVHVSRTPVGLSGIIYVGVRIIMTNRIFW